LRGRLSKAKNGSEPSDKKDRQRTTPHGIDLRSTKKNVHAEAKSAITSVRLAQRMRRSRRATRDAMKTTPSDRETTATAVAMIRSVQAANVPARIIRRIIGLILRHLASSRSSSSRWAVEALRRGGV
jgi:hypothetical protein